MLKSMVIIMDMHSNNRIVSQVLEPNIADGLLLLLLLLCLSCCSCSCHVLGRFQVKIIIQRLLIEVHSICF